MYNRVFLRLEPLGLELVADALRRAGHAVQLIDLQIFRHRDYFRLVQSWQPEAIGFCLNYLANVPEVLDLAQKSKQLQPGCFVFVGGHSVSFIAEEVVGQSAGAVDCALRGEGEVGGPLLLAAFEDGTLEQVPGVVTRRGAGPPPTLLASPDRFRPARDLLRRRRRYFLGPLDPCASIELSRGCPWQCAFCSAWTFYSRTYRKVSPEAAVDQLRTIPEPNVYITDDVAFVDPDHGMAVAEAVQRAGIRKGWYLETRADVLLRNRPVFARWKDLGLKYMFLGIEALDDRSLKDFRKHSTTAAHAEALHVARKLGIHVAVNIIAEPTWDRGQFERLRQWAMAVPEIVHLTVKTPYPGTEIWGRESHRVTTLDYRLFDVQHAVLPTALPLHEFYRELVLTQSVLARKHMGLRALKGAAGIAVGCLLRGQTNFVRMLWRFSAAYHADRLYADHHRPVRHQLRAPRRTDPRYRCAQTLLVHSLPAAPPARTA